MHVEVHAPKTHACAPPARQHGLHPALFGPPAETEHPVTHDLSAQLCLLWQLPLPGRLGRSLGWVSRGGGGCHRRECFKSCSDSLGAAAEPRADRRGRECHTGVTPRVPLTAAHGYFTGLV